MKVTKELIEEAKRRYPIGTCFSPAHLTCNSFWMVVKSHEHVDEISIGKTGYITFHVHNDNAWTPVVYNEGNWAKIKPREEELKVETVINNYQIF